MASPGWSFTWQIDMLGTAIHDKECEFAWRSRIQMKYLETKRWNVTSFLLISFKA